MGKRRTGAVVPSVKRKIDLAAPVSERVQIEHVILAESVTRRRPRCDAPPKELSLNVDVKTEARKQDLIVQVLPRFTLIGRDDIESAEESLRIEALFVVLYRVPTLDGITKENIDAFGEMNGVYNVWPYWREFVQSMTVRMGLPPLTVPVFRPLATGTPRSAKKKAAPLPGKVKKPGRGDSKSKSPCAIARRDVTSCK